VFTGRQIAMFLHALSPIRALNSNIITEFLDRGTTTPTMPKHCKRFAVGHFMKAKRELIVQAAQDKASCLKEIKNEQQNLRRLKAKVRTSILKLKPQS